jgi:hypothetical protein
VGKDFSFQFLPFENSVFRSRASPSPRRLLRETFPNVINNAHGGIVKKIGFTRGIA